LEVVDLSRIKDGEISSIGDHLRIAEENLRSRATELDKLMETVAWLEAENMRLQSELAAASSSYSRRIDELDQELDSLKSELAAAATQRTSLEARLTTSVSETGLLRTQLEERQSLAMENGADACSDPKTKELLDEIKHLNKCLDDVEADKEELYEAFTTGEDKCKKLMKDLAHAKQLAAESKCESERLSGAVAEATALRAQLLKLQQIVAASQTPSQDVTDLHRQVIFKYINDIIIYYRF
jgi:chromosome segregation ATPase